MSAQLLDGKKVAAELKAQMQQRVAKLKEHGLQPGLGTVLVGSDPGSTWYVNGKHADCAEVGIESIREDLPEDATEAEVLAAIERLNQNPACTGYIVQLPLPKQVDTNKVLAAIDPAKDADGLHPFNLGNLVLRVNEKIDSPLPCTPAGIIELAKYFGIDFAGKHVVVIGRGTTVGRSIGLLLTRKEINATVTLTHSATTDLATHLRSADIVVAAAGFPGIVKAADLKPGVVLFDVGVSRKVDPETGKSVVVGDVAQDAYDVASWVSPNPGGVGPMTRAMLLENVVASAERVLAASE